MICAIHQPQFLPWLGYLHKIACSDVFVFLDNVQFKKNEFQNRNKILVGNEAKWITVPVTFDFGDAINETKIADNQDWCSRMTNTISQNYARTPYFKEYGHEFIDIINRDWENLAKLNQATVEWLMKCFGIRSEILTASNLPISSSDPTQRLIDICLHVKANTYLSGSGGLDYLDSSKFDQAGIHLEFQNFLHPQYTQYHHDTSKKDFISNLSAVDMLFNCGKSYDIKQCTKT